MTIPAAPELPGTIRAARIHAFGGPEVLRIDTVPTPLPAPGEILVRVAYAGLNPLDHKLRDGSSAKASQLELPAILGRELSGTVLAAGEGVDLGALGLAVGSPVFGMRGADDWRGTDAEIVAIPAAHLAPALPLGPRAGGTPGATTVDLVPYGGLALAGLTARAAVELAHVAPGDTVLVHGGSGGVGQIIVPLLVAAGAGRVWATGRSENALRIAELGATPIPYDDADWREVIRESTDGKGVDVVIDTHYFSTFLPSLDLLAPDGRIVVLPTLADLTPATERGIEAHIPAISPTREVLDELARDLASGRIPLEVSAVLPLTEIARGHELLEDGHTRGKIVLAL
ncbi:NADP-dependent oxidoreductase [Brachybacterium sp. AOP25-B2-12]|uniref:NADP-dependent oxidoreductase n=1 Tax=Brachybacterium sp. AOP25-B2-12 TaxID=3457710 RepID=UPI0040332B32